ncbi:nucleotidyltransferase family protein [Trichothermofontia sp.]
MGHHAINTEINRGTIAMQPEEYAAYLQGARQRRQQQQRQLQAYHQTLLAVAAQAAQILKQEFGAQQVWLFGSVLVPQSIHAYSDLDLAVAALDPSQYFVALARLLDLDPNVSVDLVEIERASEGLRSRILSEGRVL